MGRRPSAFIMNPWHPRVAATLREMGKDAEAMKVAIAKKDPAMADLMASAALFFIQKQAGPT